MPSQKASKRRRQATRTAPPPVRTRGQRRASPVVLVAAGVIALLIVVGIVLGVVLTGMGDDGLAGARALVAAGGRVLTEAERSCVVYGMPRVVKEAGLSSGEFELAQMAAAISARI